MTVVGDVKSALRALYGQFEILFQKKIDHCSLDPGGMMCITTHYFEFKIDGNNFGVKSDQIEPVLSLWKKARITDNIAEVPIWLRVLVLPKNMYLEIQKKLEALHVSDIALHAELTREEIFQKLEGSGHFLRNPPPKEDPKP